MNSNYLLVYEIIKHLAGRHDQKRHAGQVSYQVGSTVDVKDLPNNIQAAIAARNSNWVAHRNNVWKENQVSQVDPMNTKFGPWRGEKVLVIDYGYTENNGFKNSYYVAVGLTGKVAGKIRKFSNGIGLLRKETARRPLKQELVQNLGVNVKATDKQLELVEQYRLEDHLFDLIGKIKKYVDKPTLEIRDISGMKGAHLSLYGDKVKLEMQFRGYRIDILKAEESGVHDYGQYVNSNTGRLLRDIIEEEGTSIYIDPRAAPLSFFADFPNLEYRVPKKIFDEHVEEMKKSAEEEGESTDTSRLQAVLDAHTVQDRHYLYGKFLAITDTYEIPTQSLLASDYNVGGLSNASVSFLKSGDRYKGADPGTFSLAAVEPYDGPFITRKY